MLLKLRHTHNSTIFVLLSLLYNAVPLMAQSTQPTHDVYLRLAGETEANLKTQILAKWFPVAMDEKGGGFFQNYSFDWKLLPSGSKAIVYESRLTWTSAQAAMRFPDQRDMYLAQTRHGLAFLAAKMWDQQNGGFYWAVDDSGKPTARGARKQGYGNAFAIYAAAANYKATGDAAALDLAKRAFQWYDSHAHDAKNGGYLEIAPEPGQSTDSGPNAVGARGNQKSMNTSIHILEALTGLYEVWPDPALKSRLQEMFLIVRDRVYVDPGYLIQFFNQDWTPLQSEDSYGHDVETA